jgi:hypothetical protein
MLNFILNLFSKKHQVAQISANVATSLNTCFFKIQRSNGGEVFSVFKDDKFILGYIFGTCNVASHTFNLKNPKHQISVVTQVHEHLFKENSQEITSNTSSLNIDKNDLFKQGQEIALTEYYSFISTVMKMKGNTEPSLKPLKSLDEYLSQNYSDLIGDCETGDESGFYNSMVEIVQLRNSIEQIYTKYQLPEISDSVKNKLEPEIIAIAQLLAKESVKRSGRTLNQLSDDESFTAMMFCFIASDYLTKRAELDFEVLSAVALTTLLDAINQKENTGLIAEVINSYNSMISSQNDSKLIIAIGSQVSKFFASNDDEYLDSLGRLFELMAVQLKPKVV